MKKLIFFFHRKKMVHSRTYAPAQLYKAVEVNGRKYVLAMQTNVTIQKGNPMLQIPVKDVVGIRIIPSPFDLWLDKVLKRKRSKTVKLLAIK